MEFQLLAFETTLLPVSRTLRAPSRLALLHVRSLSRAPGAGETRTSVGKRMFSFVRALPRAAIGIVKIKPHLCTHDHE